MNLNVGGKYTVIYPNRFSTCSRIEITITGKTIPVGGSMSYEYKIRGKRKTQVGITRHAFVFAGWDLPLSVDTDHKVGVKRSNGFINMTGDVDTIKYYIKNKNLNEDVDLDKMLLVDVTTSGDSGIVVMFPRDAERLNNPTCTGREIG